ncbi:type VII secretion-associated serine protease mycosin [Nocardia cyriacigeorgica]|uniref:Type VII secretion-associated serine protease mycosin n=1 Tax=Nocardia cyriacigeorgica TaxID=135487 RepID=A0A6P1D6K3_9NOCA|nr:type VII secretion-associated serine protease mycosin [Nocardia cyriacigeorgica]NEW40658.1 type VII secretion-associated serine protease mycosin [Nocardia cyriacigeorgica]NEW45131.1 type VII secretion-associated serine protease mycosin [Nocardia cyriacigeorgica]NEW54303.1 type VII secretion-associated serine protease mycosin [Nocardia cyriacigeorgica]
MGLGRLAVAGLAGLMLAIAAGPAAAVQPPEAVVGPPPPDEPPGPEFPTKQDKACLATGVLPDSDLSQVPPPDLALDLSAARALSRGTGVTVAVIDTGVQPNPRLPTVVGGGDYVTAGGDGLSDCDAHGTLIAGIIGAAADPADAFVGVAPEAKILSIRYRSGAFRPELPSNAGPGQQQLAVEVRALARAIVRAANLGAGVITVSLPICVPVDAPVDHAVLAAAVGYATQVRGSLIVAGAGNAGGNGCQQNPGMDPGNPGDERNWSGVQTISTPGWYSPTVLTVGFSTATGTPMPDSLTGPWVSVSAPGTGIESVGPGGTGLINGVGEPGKLVPVAGASFAAAYVSGVAALLRSRFPNETPAEIIARLQAAAHEPARGIDNAIGAGMIDPMAALSYRTPPQPPAGLFQAGQLRMPDPPRADDARPAVTATIVVVVAVLLGAAATYAGNATRRRR